MPKFAHFSFVFKFGPIRTKRVKNKYFFPVKHINQLANINTDASQIEVEGLVDIIDINDIDDINMFP